MEIQPVKDRPLSIVAGGPSLLYRWPDLIGDVLSLNNTYSFLIEKGIVPKYWMLLDAREENVEFLRDAHPDVEHYVAGQCHPAVFDRLSGFKTTFYLTQLPDTLEIVKDIDKPKHQLAGAAGTVGMRALSLAYALGYRELHLYGYDSSYMDGEHHAYKQALNDDSKTIEVFIDGKQFVTTPAFAHQSTEFPAFASAMVAHYGCSIDLHCDGLLPAVMQSAMQRGEQPLVEREREKYRAMWSNEKYRKTAPGEFHVEQAIHHLGMSAGDSVIDFGCGTGRGAQRFQELGFQVTAVDFASNCLDEGVKVPFVEACLWDLPPMKAKFGYCTDVMEHIPMEKVMDVLRGIHERCEAVYFNVATRDDSLGVLIGHKLHMTVMDAQAWLGVLRRFWSIVEMAESDGEATFICKEPYALR